MYKFILNTFIQDMEKSEDLEKGEKGDWKKEGYTLEHATPQKDTGGKFHTIHATDSKGDEAGKYEFFEHDNHSIHGPSLTVQHATTYGNHKRKGLASAAYKHIENKTGKKIIRTTDDQSKDAKKLWANKDRKFGKSEKFNQPEQDVNLIHYSPEQGLKTIEPKYHGVRSIGAEVRHTSPEHRMSFYYTEGTKPEDLVVSGAKSKYIAKLGNKKVYDIATDPEGIIAAGKEKANEKQINRGIFTHDDLHDTIKAAGYHGFKNSSLGPQMGNVIAMYHPMEVQEHPIEFGKNVSDFIIKLDEPSYVLKKNLPRISVSKEKGVSSRPDQQVYPASMSSGKKIRKPSGADTNYIKSKIESSHLNEKYQKYTPDEAEESAHRISRSLTNNGPTRGVFIADKKGNHQAFAGGEGEGHTTEHEGFHLLSQQILDKHGPEKHLKFLQDLNNHIHPQIKNLVYGSLQSDPNYRNMSISSNPRYKAVYLEEAINLTRDLNANPNYRKQIKNLHNVNDQGVSSSNNPYHTAKYRDTDSWLKNSWKKIVNHAKNYNFQDQVDQSEQPLAASEQDIVIEKGLKSNLAGIGLAASLAMSPMSVSQPTASNIESSQERTPSVEKEKTPSFGSQPEDHFLHNVMQVETSGGTNLDHPQIKFGMHKGTTAVGRFALMPNTIKETAKRYKMQGLSHPDVDVIHNMPVSKVGDYISKNPNAELELARTLAKHVIGRHGNNEKAAYAWKYGHNLTPKGIDKQKLLSDDYTRKFAVLNRGQSIENLTPASVAFGSRGVAGDIKKTEDLEKGINGDWQSEGYKIKVREGKYGHGVYAYGPDRKRVGHALMGKYPSNSGHLRVSASEIQEPHQGKGLYQAMLQAAADHAKSLGHKGIMSEGFQRSPDATRAWEKVSHRTIDSGYPTTQRHKQPDGSWEDVKVHTPRIDHYLDKAENINSGDDFDHSPSDPAEFHQALIHHASNNPYIKENVHIHSPEEYSSSKTFLSKDKKSGYALKPDGELMSVFSGEKGRGDHLMSSAIKNGAQHLDSFDGFLPKFYSRHGFKEYKREKNWTEGGPDVVYMKRDPITMVKSENNPLPKPSTPQQLTGPVESSSVQQPLAASSSIQQAPKHSEKVRSIAESYMKSKGQTLQHPTSKVKVDPAFGAKVAAAYDQMPHNPHDPEVKAAYQALNKETLDQFNHIMSNSGLKISKMKPGMPNPYMNSKDMTKDIHENNHLWYYPTDEGFGSSDFIPTEHPSLTPTEHLDSEGKPMLANDLFRIVHDYFGHAKEGNTFNHDGEENAYLAHRAMFSPLAARAMSANTRGQNSWVNFGPHGEHNRKNPAKTIYADQKVGLLPEWAEQPNLPMKKSEVEEADLAKGSLQRRLGNPKKNVTSKEYTSMNTWKNSIRGRDTIPEASPEHKQRFFHKLHSQTEVRKHPQTGERMFLMHRGVGELNSRIPHEFNKTSWTPDYSVAKGFSTNDDHDDRPEVKRGKIYSAWIPESAIHNYINNAASKHNTDLRHEQEYIIKPHKFIYAKKQKLDPSSMVNENINARQDLKQVYGKDIAYNGQNRADQEIKSFNKKLPRPKKLETPESVPTSEKLAASEKDKVKSFMRHPREIYRDKQAQKKRNIIAEGKRKETGAKKPLDIAIDKLKVDKAEMPKLPIAPKPFKTGDRVNHLQHGVGTVRQNHGDGHLTVGFDNSKDTSLNYKGLKVHSNDFKKSEEELMKGSFQSRNKAKISPQEIENTKKWVNATDTVTAIPSKEAKEARENLKQPPEMLNRLKQRLSKETHLRKHPETGELLALLHRGMSNEEHDAHSDGLNINHDHATSWTARKNIAESFGGDYAGGKKRVVSAWVPISKITAAPYLIPAKSAGYSQDDIFQNAPRSEREIIVGPDHNSLMTHANFEPKKDTIGQKVKDFKGGRWNRKMITNQINKEKEQEDLAASESIESDLNKMSQPIPSFPKVKSITTRPDSEIKPLEEKTYTLPPKNDKISRLDGTYGMPRRFTQGDYAAKKFQAKMGRENPDIAEIIRNSVDSVAQGDRTHGSVISTGDKRVIMGQYNVKTGDPTKMHEAYHFTTKQLGQKLGLNEQQTGKISSHLLTHIHPDDYKAFRTIITARGYDPRKSDFDEEVVAHMGNYLNDKNFRESAHSAHLRPALINAPEEALAMHNLVRNPHETLNPSRFKAGYKQLIRAAKDLDEDKIKEITLGKNNET